MNRSSGTTKESQNRTGGKEDQEDMVWYSMVYAMVPYTVLLC